MSIKLTVKDTDKKWTEVAKKIINGLMDYASKTNKFDTVRIGGHQVVDDLPGFYITFPDLDDQDRIAYSRTENTFTFVCLIAVKGENEKEALEEILEIHGELLAKLQEDADMAGVPNGVPDVGVPQVYNMEVTGIKIGAGTGQTTQSYEYIYGATTIMVATKLNLRG